MQLNAQGVGGGLPPLGESHCRVLGLCNVICLSLKCRSELAGFVSEGPSGEYFRLGARMVSSHLRPKQVASCVGSQIEVCPPRSTLGLPPPCYLVILASRQMYEA